MASTSNVSSFTSSINHIHDSMDFRIKKKFAHFIWERRGGLAKKNIFKILTSYTGRKFTNSEKRREIRRHSSFCFITISILDYNFETILVLAVFGRSKKISKYAC